MIEHGATWRFQSEGPKDGGGQYTAEVARAMTVLLFSFFLLCATCTLIAAVVRKGFDKDVFQE